MSARIEDWTERIQKLLRKAEGNTTAEEAEALVTKAQELMTKYAITEAMLASTGQRAKDRVVTETIVFTGIYSKVTKDLAFSVAKANECLAVWSGVGKSNIHVYVTGFESDVARVKLLTQSLEVQAVASMQRWWRTYDSSYMSGMDKFKQRRQFIASFGWAVASRLREAQQRVTMDAEAADSGVAIVLASKRDEVAAAFQQQWPRLRKTRTRMQGGTWAAREAGDAAGRRANIGNPGLGGSRELGGGK